LAVELSVMQILCSCYWYWWYYCQS